VRTIVEVSLPSLPLPQPESSPPSNSTVDAPITYDKYHVELLDLTPSFGRIDYGKNQRPFFRQSDALVICASTVRDRNKTGTLKPFYHATTARHDNPYLPVLLVGTKTDLKTNPPKDSEDREYITVEDGERVAKEVGASGYMECSALTRDGLDKILEKIAILAREEKKRKEGEKVDGRVFSALDGINDTAFVQEKPNVFDAHQSNSCSLM